MTSKTRIRLGIILFVFVFLGPLLFMLYRQPLGPALELPTPTQALPTLTTFSVEDIAIDSTATGIQPAATQTSAINVL